MRTESPSYPSELTIDLSAIRSNYGVIAARVAPAECGAVIKADAYGLGARQVARALGEAGCRTFFVAQLSEALALRATIGPTSTIAILNGLDPGCEGVCADHGFLPVLNSASQVERWRASARDRGRPLPAALQIDSGMSRLGLSTDLAAALACDHSFLSEVPLRLLMTHLACGDEPHSPANAAQLERFRIAQLFFPGIPSSIANSGGTALSDAFHLDLVRPGLALFGVTPDTFAKSLTPVVGLKARILQIRDIPAGTAVGYGLDYVAAIPQRIATVGVGYADGWPRHLGNVGAAWRDGHRLAIIGRVSMDSFAIDLSALAANTIGEGDFVELIGPSQRLESIAGEAGTIAYELLTRLGRRHRRIYVDEDRTDILSPGVDE